MIKLASLNLLTVQTVKLTHLNQTQLRQPKVMIFEINLANITEDALTPPPEYLPPPGKKINKR